MNVSDIKTYLQSRPFPLDIPTDQELEKYMNFAILIIKVFYGVDPTTFIATTAVTIIGEEVAYLIETNPFEDIYKMYNYLKKFSVAGAISGEVIEKTIGMLGTFVKNLMAAEGYEMLEVDTGKAYYTYSIF